MLPFVKQFVEFWLSRKEQEARKNPYNKNILNPNFSNPMDAAKFLEDKGLTYIPDKLDSYTSPKGVYAKLSGQDISFSWNEFDCDDYSNLFGFMISNCKGVSNIKLRNIIDGLIQASHVICTFEYLDVNNKKWFGIFSTDTYKQVSGSIVWSNSEFDEQTLLRRYSEIYNRRTYIGVVDCNIVVF